MESKKQVLQTFFFFRASGETNLDKWATILSKDFYMTTPITPYRIFSPAEVSSIYISPPPLTHSLQVVCGIRCLQGVDALNSDTASLHTMVQALATRHAETVRFSPSLMLLFPAHCYRCVSNISVALRIWSALETL
jgi:hypothetical protein